MMNNVREFMISVQKYDGSVISRKQIEVTPRKSKLELPKESLKGVSDQNLGHLLHTYHLIAVN